MLPLYVLRNYVSLYYWGDTNRIYMGQVTNQRFGYIDVSKVLAMFLVTWAHCAQQLSGNLFPVLFISKDSFISFNMAIFMIASGFVLNIPKMRKAPFMKYIYLKALRLLLPMITWLFIWSIVIYPKFLDYWSAYWYLSSMFLCLLTIKALSYVFTSDMMLCFASIVVLSLIPFHSFERTCYMIPFLWIGYGLRFIINHINVNISIILSVFFCFLYYFWDVHYSIYMSPLHIWDINRNDLFSAAFRVVIGTIGGVTVISWIRLCIDYYHIVWIYNISIYGQYTLVFYTMSFVLNSLLSRILWHVDYYITLPGILDFVSFVLSITMMTIMFYFQKRVERNRLLCTMLGIVYKES